MKSVIIENNKAAQKSSFFLIHVFVDEYLYCNNKIIFKKKKINRLDQGLNSDHLHSSRPL